MKYVIKLLPNINKLGREHLQGFSTYGSSWYPRPLWTDEEHAKRYDTYAEAEKAAETWGPKVKWQEIVQILEEP